PLTSMPVTVLGLTFPRSIKRLLLLTLWSKRNEYRLVPSNTGKLPICEFRVRNDAGKRLHKRLPLGFAAVGATLHEVMNCVNGDGVFAGPGIRVPSSRAKDAGYDPLIAVPDDAPTKAAYSAASWPYPAAKTGLIPASITSAEGKVCWK